MVGARLCELLVRRGFASEEAIAVFGEESVPAYDRVHLSDLFTGEKTAADLELRAANWYDASGIALHRGDPVVRIETWSRRLYTASGAKVAYDRLVLATGSRPVLPELPGFDGPRVRVYRTLEDLWAIAEHARPGARMLILGAGLLGLELAGVLARLGVRVTLVERAPRLLPRHLERAASQTLADTVERLGVEVHCGVEVLAAKAIDSAVELQIKDSPPLDADLLIVAAGVRPRDELARDAGLTCERRGGIVVDDELRTSDPNTFAVGECVVHRGVHYGLVSPGLRMAEVLADGLTGIPARFEGVPFSARLKLDAIELSMLGESEAGDADTQELTATQDGVYRRILLRGGRVIGATAVGAWSALPRVQEAIARGERIGARQQRRFERCAEIWRNSQTRSVESWPDSTTVCSCTGVTCGVLRKARSAGCETVAALACETGASSVCGSCAPLLAQLCGDSFAVESRRQAPLIAASIAASLLASLLVWVAPIPLADTVQLSVPWDTLWRSSFARQLTGFSVLAVSLASLTLTARKRWSRVSFGSFTGWRSLHALLGVSALVLAGVHTGLDLGAHMNRLLMLSFLALGVLGAGAGIVTALERRLHPRMGPPLRRAWTLAHVLVLSPFSVLLGFHLFKVYYF